MKMIALPKKRQERRNRLSSEGQCISQRCFKVNFKQKKCNICYSHISVLFQMRFSQNLFLSFL